MGDEGCGLWPVARFVMTRFDVIVIGAGVNGLAAAAYLARRGRRVIVLERRERVGGTTDTEEFHAGFRANVCRDDAGWVPERLMRDLRLPKHGLKITRAPVGLVATQPDAPPIPFWSDLPRTVEALRTVSSRDAERWADFCALVARVAGVLRGAYGQRPPLVQSRATSDLLALAALGSRLRNLGRREMMEALRALPMPIADLADEWFGHPVIRGALATEGVRGVLHGPLSSGTAFVFFHQHVGTARGEVGVRRVIHGGVSALAVALAGAARAFGADVRTNAEVQDVTVRNGRVNGVTLSGGEELRAAVVVSSADPQRTFALVDPLWLDAELLRAIDNVRMRGATARVHFALDGLPAFSSGGRAWEPEVLAGTMTVSPGIMGLERAYDDAKYGQMPAEPALTVTIPSVTDPTLAPAGRHVVSVDVHHVPCALNGGWGVSQRAALGNLIEVHLSRIAWDFRDRVLHRWVLTPPDLIERYGITGGSLTHGELALDQVLFMRPVPQCARYATPLPGLWLCGTGTHPASTGGACGMLAAREILARDRANA